MGVNIELTTSVGVNDTTCGGVVCKSNIVFRGCKTIARNGQSYGISSAMLRQIWNDNGTGCPNPVLTKRCAQMADNASDADSVERVLTCTATECTRDNSVAGNIFLDNAGGTCGCP